MEMCGEEEYMFHVGNRLCVNDSALENDNIFIKKKIGSNVTME